MRIEFDQQAHAYRIDGTPVPNVSRVLADLFDWRSVPSALLERKRQIGTAVHRAIELDARDELDESSLDPQIAGYFEAYRRFRKEAGFVASHSEQAVASWRYRYAGTLDLLGTLRGEQVLIDVKTSAALHPAVELQTAAYHHAAAEMGLLPRTAKRHSLNLKTDGTYKLRPHSKPNDFPVFLSCLSRHNWRAAHGLIEGVHP